jgi:hypothetical protein
MPASAFEKAANAIETMRAECDALDEPERTPALAFADGALTQIQASAAWIEIQRQRKARTDD